MDNFAQHMFQSAVRDLQEQAGMAERFQHGYRNRLTSGIDDDVRAFIESRTSIYIATTSDTGWPYVQHRGGAAGFIKVLDAENIGFADYRGNKQFISQGHLQTNDKVSIIMMDYPRRAQLKLIGHAKMVEAAEAPDMVAAFTDEGAPEAERIATITVTALDWNCPKYIEPRYTEAEIEQMLAPRMTKIDEHIQSLEAQLAEARAQVEAQS